MSGKVPLSLSVRFQAKILPEPNSGCWLWIARCDHDGYGRMWIGSRTDRSRAFALAHRISYEMHVGQISAGFELDHKCRVRCCVNPDHLEPVTHAENSRRGFIGIAAGAKQRAKTHCPAGHAYIGDNLYVTPTGERQCRACRRLNYHKRKDRPNAWNSRHG